MDDLRRSLPTGPRRLPWGCLAVLVILTAVPAARAENWDLVEFVRHAAYQAVNADGSSGFDLVNGFPLRLRGVVLNDTEDWLDPTAAYDPGVHLFQMGGQAEFYLQAVDLPGESWDDGDFGGTACWMGQNYGNHMMHQDPEFNYTDAEWYAELDRLHLWCEGTEVVPLVRAGMLVEIRALAGLHYAGKMNVNEKHWNDPSHDFEIVILDENFGLPTPTAITLDAVKDAADQPIFDPTRNTGGERYQSTLVEFQNVRFLDDSGWGRNKDLVLVDDSGRSLKVHLGLSEGFDLVAAPSGWFNVVGILDQKASNQTYAKDGYQLLVMDAGDFAAATVPEPATAALLAMGACGLLLGAWRRRRRVAGA